ncbi:MAG: aminotransferase, partial [Anaerolineaceae bacterium]|nr:aminotransferase [Anaerolineaceae bacterium]
PQGGLFLWATFPELINTTEMLKDAVEARVAYVPGEYFYPCEGGTNTMRLNFSNATPERINEGIARLGRIVRQKLS